MENTLEKEGSKNGLSSVSPSTHSTSKEMVCKMSGKHDESILRSLRRIMRAIAKYNRNLSSTSHLTIPQLFCLQQMLFANEDLTPGKLAENIHLSQATITGILDRLEARGLVKRTRGTKDRRQVTLTLTENGRQTAREMPWPLQESFSKKLSGMPEEEQEEIDRVLRKIVDMMEI